MNTRSLFAVAGFTAAAGLSSCSKQQGGVGGAEQNKIVYVLSNDYHDNANAILAYKRKSDGRLEALPGSPFLTRGAGLGNPTEALGPDDTDDPLVISPDGRYLLAVNGGSNTVAVFTINSNGSLTPVAGSPFASGGQTPCSIAINGSYVYVANKSFDALHTITRLPNYVSFTINGAGRLEQVAGGKVEVSAGSAPSQVLVSNDHRHLFATNFLAFMLPTETPVGTLESFSLLGSGAFKAAAGSPYVLPMGDGGALGLAEHPVQPILYVGFPVASSVGVYSVDAAAGSLKLLSTVSAGAAACWLRTNARGTRLYVLNSGENSVGVYDITNASAPVFMSKLVLKNSGSVSDGKGGTSLASGDFALNFSPEGNILYVVSQDINLAAGGDYNYLHSLAVGSDGSLTESGEPLSLPVPADVRPLGVVTR